MLYLDVWLHNAKYINREDLDQTAHIYADGGLILTFIICICDKDPYCKNNAQIFFSGKIRIINVI